MVFQTPILPFALIRFAAKYIADVSSSLLMLSIIGPPINIQCNCFRKKRISRSYAILVIVIKPIGQVWKTKHCMFFSNSHRQESPTCL